VRVFEEDAVGAGALTMQVDVGTQLVEFGVAQDDDLRIVAGVRYDVAGAGQLRRERDENLADLACLGSDPGV